jgi:hypothetical protein
VRKEEVSELIKQICEHYHLDRNKMESIQIVIDDDTDLIEVVQFKTTAGDTFKLTKKELAR